MEKYNLDEKGGLPNLFKKKPSKILLKGDTIEFNHFSSFSSVKMLMLDVTDSTVKLQLTEVSSDLKLNPEDIIVLTYFNNKDYYVISGQVASIEKVDPLEITVNLRNVEKAKDLRKVNKRYVSFMGTINLSGTPEGKSAAIIKVVGLKAIKVDCKDELQIGNKVDVLANLDKKNKLSFKGEIVRKHKAGNSFEYGIEVKDITESNSRLMHSCVGGLLE